MLLTESAVPMLDIRALPGLLIKRGVRTPWRALVFNGLLTPVTVGTRTYVRWQELAPLLPDWAPEASPKFLECIANLSTVDSVRVARARWAA